MHQALVTQPLPVNLGDLAVEGMVVRPDLLGPLVKGVQSQTKSNGYKSQHSHSHAQALDGRSKVGEGASGEIESYAHYLAPASAPATPAMFACPSAVIAPVSGRGASSTMVSSGSSSQRAKASALLSVT